MRRALFGFLLALVLVPFGSCSSGPAAPNGGLDGTWSGSITDSASGGGTATFVLAQTGAGVSGTFALTFPDPAQNKVGRAGGTLAASVLILTMTPDRPVTCAPGVTLSGTLSAPLTITGTRMKGSYSSFTCGGATGGTIDVARP